MQAEEYMQQALALAGTAAGLGEVPVGCVIADEAGNVIGRGYNRRETDRSALAHAEIEAIRQACAARGTWRLTGCSLYVTLEPCPMCAGAILNARISNVYFGAKDENTGSCGSVIHLFWEDYGFQPRVQGGVLEEPCRQILSDFFADLRKK